MNLSWIESADRYKSQLMSTTISWPSTVCTERGGYELNQEKIVLARISLLEQGLTQQRRLNVDKINKDHWTFPKNKLIWSSNVSKDPQTWSKIQQLNLAMIISHDLESANVSRNQQTWTMISWHVEWSVDVTKDQRKRAMISWRGQWSADASNRQLSWAILSHREQGSAIVRKYHVAWSGIR